jgi:hypothetical protein
MPELFPGTGSAQISIRRGPCLVPVRIPDGLLSFSFSFDGVARYCVFRGEEILVDPLPQADESSVRLFLLSTGMGALLHQRNIPLIHGSAIGTSKGAVIFAGPSGSGKSTLAAAFFKRGCKVLADEISAIRMSESVSVLPGQSSLMLWKDVLAKLSIDSSSLIPVRPHLEKYLFPLAASYQSLPLPLRKIYLLETSNGTNCSLVPLRGTEKLGALTSNLYRPRIILDMGLEGPAYSQIVELAARIEVVRLIRPICRFRVEELVDFLGRDLGL